MVVNQQSAIAHPPCQSGGRGAGRWPDHEEEDNEDDDHEKDDYDDRPLSRFAGEMMKSNTN